MPPAASKKVAKKEVTKKSEPTTAGRKRRSSIATPGSSAASSRAASAAGADTSSSPASSSAAAASHLSGSFASVASVGAEDDDQLHGGSNRCRTPPPPSKDINPLPLQSSPAPNLPQQQPHSHSRSRRGSAAEVSQSPQTTTTGQRRALLAESASPARGGGGIKLEADDDQEEKEEDEPPRSAHDALVAADKYALRNTQLYEDVSKHGLPMGVSINHFTPPSTTATKAKKGGAKSSSSSSVSAAVNVNINHMIAPIGEVEVGRGTPDDPMKMITFAEKQLRRLRDRILNISASKKRGGGASTANVLSVAVKKEEDNNNTNIVPLPDDAECNLSGCAHCSEVSHCDCVFLEETMEEVYSKLSLKRIIERGSATTTPVMTPSNSNAGTPRRRGDLDAENSVSNPIATVSMTTAIIAEDSNTSAASNTTSRAVAAAPGRSGRHFCAKSLLTPFVARLARLQAVSPLDVYYDLGCGNGSILFQIAYSTGAACIGVELCPHNAQIARDAWDILRPILEARSGRKMPPVYIITGDICNVIDDPQFISSTMMSTSSTTTTTTTAPTPKRKILLSNLLFPKMLTQYISQRCRQIASIGTSIVCFDDLYPHGRSLCQKRDPEAFELFEMKDYIWPTDSVEWCRAEGAFYIHTRKEKL